jgi:AcrR family transcriptional regulator
MGDQRIQQEERHTEKRQRLSAEQRRALMLVRAKEVFAQHSYSGASTSELASASGVTEPMLYKHFGSKKGLFMAVLEHFSAQFIQEWERRIDYHAQISLKTALVELATDFYAVVKADPEVPRVIFQGEAASADDPEFGEATGRHIMAVYHIFRRVLEEAQAAQVIDASVNLDAASWGYMSMAFAMQFSLIYGPHKKTHREPPSDWMLREASRLWLRGLLPQKA